MTSHEMQQLIRDTYNGVATVMEVPGNPNIMGHWLFHIDGEKGMAKIYINPNTGAIWGKG